MPRIQLARAFAAGVLALACAQATVASSRVLSVQGIRHFVVVDRAAAQSEDALRSAATSLCPTAKPCVVLFWSDERLAASGMPMTRAQRDGIIAQFTRNPASGHEELLVRCGTDGGAARRCLK